MLWFNTRFDAIYINMSMGKRQPPGHIFYIRLSNVSANERSCYICNIFCHWQAQSSKKTGSDHLSFIMEILTLDQFSNYFFFLQCVFSGYEIKQYMMSPSRDKTQGILQWFDITNYGVTQLPSLIYMYTEIFSKFVAQCHIGGVRWISWEKVFHVTRKWCPSPVKVSDLMEWRGRERWGWEIPIGKH